jgi:hypothetical protein
MRRFLIPLFMIGTAVMIYIMITTGAPLKTPLTPKGILNLEFAFDKEHTDVVMKAWASDNKTGAAIKNTMWDFVFLFFYSLFLFFTCKQLRTKFTPLNWKYNAGKFFAGAAITAGLLDAGENLGMLQTLHGNGSDTIALVTVICSLIKWTLVLLVITYVLIALLSKRQTTVA